MREHYEDYCSAREGTNHKGIGIGSVFKQKLNPLLTVPESVMRPTILLALETCFGLLTRWDVRGVIVFRPFGLEAMNDPHRPLPVCPESLSRGGVSS